MAVQWPKLAFSHSEGRTWILIRGLTNPRGNLAPGCWALGWFPGSSASSYRGIEVAGGVAAGAQYLKMDTSWEGLMENLPQKKQEMLAGD